ncbi:Os10g0138150 [Oryza sativa Japonica Group]|uniref:Os10g0138150 protein n=1 Tax=Oryza sativa subsp. japonica TaxID=39947 RepID=A0A0N7KRE9_ORYSJ|nr:hypothetical protein EE612_049963 [Oryza sativa]BAT09826.1 Os10g0138150 [Oryza sativa Japonica Group]
MACSDPKAPNAKRTSSIRWLPDAASNELLAKNAEFTYETALPNGRGAARNVSKVMPSYEHQSGMEMLISNVLESHGGCFKNSSRVRHILLEATCWMVTVDPAARRTVAMSDGNDILCAMMMLPPMVAVFRTNGEATLPR